MADRLMRARRAATISCAPVGVVLGLASLLAVAVWTGCAAEDPAPAGAVDTTCDQYCTKIEAVCSGPQQMFHDRAECMASCKSLDPNRERGSTGNTLNCRLAQLDAKSCSGAGLLGGGACGDRCEGFCRAVIAACGTQPSPPYADYGQCVELCGSRLRFEAADTEGVTPNLSGDTLNCRAQHVRFAFGGPVTHCGHVTLGSPVCK